MRVNDEQPEGASKRAREDDPEEGGVPADDAAASAAASESASAQDGPDAEAGEILTASEGLAAASLACAAPMAAAPARDEAAANASVDPAATAEAAASAAGVASASAPPPTVQEPAAQDPAASAAPAFADDAAHAAPPMPRLTNEQLAHLLQSRAEAKARRDFAAADAIRGQLDGYGIKIIDGRQPGMIGTWAAADGRRCAARASSRSSASARSPRRLLPLLHLSPLLLCPATLTEATPRAPRLLFGSAGVRAETQTDAKAVTANAKRKPTLLYVITPCVDTGRRADRALHVYTGRHVIPYFFACISI